MSAKKTMLLSNEARREIAKQVRAMKEERRATLDARHKYLRSRLTDAVSLGETEVEDALISDEKVASQSASWSRNFSSHSHGLTSSHVWLFQFSLIDEFFAANGSKKLIFFYQDVDKVKRLWRSRLHTVWCVFSASVVFLFYPPQSLSSSHSSFLDHEASAVSQKKLFLTTGTCEVDFTAEPEKLGVFQRLDAALTVRASLQCVNLSCSVSSHMQHIMTDI